MQARFLLLAGALAAATVGAQPTAPRARLSETLRLDANKEDFSRIDRLYVGPRKQIVVVLPQDMQFRWYDSLGKKIGVVGRRGSGPGEFRGINAAGWIGDTLWAYDMGARRTTLIAPKATFIRATALPQPITIGADSRGAAPRMLGFLPFAIYSDGAMLGMGMTTTGRPSSQSSQSVYKVLPSGAATPVHVSKSLNDSRWGVEVGGQLELIPFRVPPQAVESWDGSRFAAMTSDVTSPEGGTFTVEVIKSNGDTAFARTYPFTGVPIPKNKLDSAATAFPPKPSPEEGAPPPRPPSTTRPKLPAVYTPAQSIILGIDNTVWITMRSTPEGRETLVLNGRGDPIASVFLPPRTTIRQANITTLWTTQSDADGLVSVVRYKVTGIACGAACR